MGVLLLVVSGFVFNNWKNQYSAFQQFNFLPFHLIFYFSGQFVLTGIPMKIHPLYFHLFLIGSLGCNEPPNPENEKDGQGFQNWNSLLVTATAYNSLSGQGKGNPTLTAWGDTLKPGMRSIAVSRDLIDKGLAHGTKVVIEGFDGIYTVNDKMHWRWKNKIDIYMGNNKQKALEWGLKKIEICFPSEGEI